MIKTVIEAKVKPAPDTLVLRRNKTVPSIVVLFTSLYMGVVLAHEDAERIGQTEDWIEYTDDDTWEPCAITLASVD